MTKIVVPPYQLLLPLLMFTLLGSRSEASRLSEAVLPMTGPEQMLLLTNPLGETQSVWITKPVQADIGPEEQKWDLPPHSKTEISLSDISTEPYFRVEATHAKVQLYWRQSKSESWSFQSWGSSNALKLSQPLIQMSLWISNPTGTSQNFQVVGLDNQVVYKSGSLKSYETQNLTYRGTAGSLKVIGDNRIAVLAHDDLLKRSVSLTPLLSDFTPATKTALFEVTNLDKSESFIIELSSAKLIQEARVQAADPNAFVSRLLVAEVSEGHRGINQDLRSRLKAPWSWHVSQVYRFADFGSIDCDGSPSLIEKTFPWWKAAKGGLICFWGYKINRELTSP